MDGISSKTPEGPTTDSGTSQVPSSTTRQTDGTSSTDAGTTESKSTTGATSPDTTTEERHHPTPEWARPTPKIEPDDIYYPPTPRPTKKVPRVSSETSEIVALVIGIIAGSLIAVILVVLVILKFQSRSERSCKIDDGKGYQQGPNAALLGNTSTNGQMQYQINGALRNGDRGQAQKKKRDSKDIKEWYV